MPKQSPPKSNPSASHVGGKGGHATSRHSENNPSQDRV